MLVMGSQVYKIVRDSIHGNIRFSGLFLDLLECPELQRLHNIKQLGFADKVFPGANHTRLEHSLGTYKMASVAGEMLSLPEDEREVIECAALLHDIGHGPFSHTLESILRTCFGVDHVDITEQLLMEGGDIFEEGEQRFVDFPSAVELLDEYGVDRKKIVALIRGDSSEGKGYLAQLLNSPIDVDQLDYLLRDGYYTGVAYGTIDVERFFQTLMIYDHNLAIKRKGVNVVENILMARGLMFSSVYFHKTVRIAELMLSKAIEFLEDAEPFEFYRYTDGEMFALLKSKGEFQREIVTRLKYRRLFKQAYMLPAVENRRKDEVKRLEEPCYRNQKEQEFEEKLGIPKGHVIIDVPQQELFLSEPRIDKVDISVVNGGEIQSIKEFTPITEAIKSRVIPDWSLMVVTDERYREEVSRKAESILFA
ncbi:MAG TPA: HD domain-containing protein [Thermoplasmata archaeon]|nr:HD domain-containing protein [Thermoplasmata archaeon]